MPSKELIEKVARSLAVVAWERAFKADTNFMMHVSPHKTPMAYEDDRWECYKLEAEAAIFTILAALQDPTEGMLEAGYAWDEHVTATETHPRNRGLWRAMLAASALGEQSE